MPDFGRYGVFVWPAYGVSALVLAAAVIGSLARARRWRRAAESGDATERSAPLTKPGAGESLG